jgi:hypothetical protein
MSKKRQLASSKRVPPRRDVTSDPRERTSEGNRKSFEALDKFSDVPFMKEGRNQPRMSGRKVFE